MSGLPGYSGQFVAEVESPITNDQLALLCSVMLHNTSFMLRIKQMFVPDTLNGIGEDVYRVFISLLYEHYDSNPTVKLPKASALVEVGARVNPAIKDLARDEILSIYLTEETSTDQDLRACEDLALSYVRRIMLDRKVTRRLREAMASSGSLEVNNISDLIARSQSEIQGIQLLVSNSVVSGVPRFKQVSNARVDFDVDVDFMNAVTEGGLPRKSVNGLFGVFGGCKTTLACQMAASRIRLEYAKAAAGYSSEFVVYANCEGQPDEIKYRVISALSKIPVKHIKDHYEERCALSGSPRHYEYENILGLDVPALNRLEMAVEQVEDHFFIIDFSGSDNNPKAGKNFVSEIDSNIEHIRSITGKGMSLFLLDYAKLFVKRYILLNNMKIDHLRHLLGAFPDMVRANIASKYDCAALILQQVNKEANKRSANDLISHTDSSEASDFGENCHFCFALSRANPESKAIKLHVSKSRDVAPPSIIPELVHVGHYGALSLSDTQVISGFRISENISSTRGYAPGLSLPDSAQGPQRRQPVASPADID
jgi:hypothetical protein